MFASSESELEAVSLKITKKNPCHEDEGETLVKRKCKLPAANSKSVLSTLSNIKLYTCHSPSTISNTRKKKLSDFSCRDNDGTVHDSQSEDRRFSYLPYSFLKPKKIRGAQRRRPDDPEYDTRTIYVPDLFKQNLTPASVVGNEYQ